jgi:hypothetical protein
MNETAISNPAKATNKAKGIKDTKNNRNPAVIIGYKKPDKMAKSMCTRLKFLTNS